MPWRTELKTPGHVAGETLFGTPLRLPDWRRHTAPQWAKVFGKSAKVHSGLSRHRSQLERRPKTRTSALQSDFAAYEQVSTKSSDIGSPLNQPERLYAGNRCGHMGASDI
jgi:hypothetical protein